MRLTLLDANPIIATGGQIAAIILCVFLLISVLLMLAINLGLTFLLSWIREKANAIKLLRPTVDSVNKSSEAALQGQQIDTTENKIARTAASLPSSVHTIDQKVDQISGKVANTAIEFRARTAQAQAIVKAFLMPSANRQEVLQPNSDDRLPVPGADSSKVIEETKTVEEQATPAVDKATRTDSSRPVIRASQRQHVSAR
jgi:hypothetical protein